MNGLSIGSLECGTCKRRKIICDRKAPECERCQVLGHNCPGYLRPMDRQNEPSFSNDISGSNDNGHMSAHVSDKDTDLAVKSEPTTTPPSRTQDPQITEDTPTSLTHALAMDLLHLREFIYIRYLMQDFILPTTSDPLSGWLKCLGILYPEAPYDSTLNLALRAAAFAYMGNKLLDTDLRLEANEIYGKALKSLMQDLEEKKADVGSATLTAGLMLGLYECIAGNGNNSFWHSHCHGLKVLMSLRAMHHPPPDLQGLTVEELPDGVILCQMQRHNLDLRQPPTPQEAIFVKSLDGSKPSNQMFSTVFQCSHVVARAHKVLIAKPSSPPTKSEITRIDRAITEITTFDGSVTRLFRSWVLPRTADGAIPRRAMSELDVQNHWLGTARTHRVMAMWIFLKGARMILLQTLLDLLEKSLCMNASSPSTITSTPNNNNPSASPNTASSEEEELTSQTLDLIHQTTSSIFATVPSMTSKDEARGPRNVGGYYLLWPLYVIISCRYTLQEDKERARRMLVGIGQEMGLRHALEIAEDGKVS